MNEVNDNHNNGQRETLVGADVPPSRAAKLTLSDRVKSLRLPNKTAPAASERSGSAWLPWSLCGLFALTTAAFAVAAFSKPPAEAPRAAPVTTLPETPGSPVAQSGALALESKGYIIPARQIQVSPKVGGMVMKLNIEEGQRVKKGDIIAEIERVEYETDRDRVRGLLAAARERFKELKVGNRPEEIHQAKAELDEAEAMRRQWYLDYERSRSLNKQVLSPKEFEAAESGFKAADRRLEQRKMAYKLMVDGPRREKIDAAQAEVDQLEADLFKAQWRLDNCTVRAPISGTILTKIAEEGNIVNQMALNLKGSLCDIADLSDLEVELKVQDRDLSKVFKGQKCRVRSDAYPDRVYDGVVSRLMPIADRSQGAVPVRVKVRVPTEEEGVYLKPEMGAVVSFLR